MWFLGIRFDRLVGQKRLMHIERHRCRHLIPMSKGGGKGLKNLLLGRTICNRLKELRHVTHPELADYQ